MPEYRTWFGSVSASFTPHAWQCELAEDARCRSRLIRVPTGLGKTLGVLGAWLYNRVVRGDDTWPRRLVWCLPMRVLVEQTEAETRKLVERMGLLWDGQPDSHVGRVGVHLLMGGSDAGEWALHPEEYAILIGTQDMLLSRVLNRGYASPRARWPMEFGLLNNDCLWVMDEVQLMDVGLVTSAQLQAFRQQDVSRGMGVRPCHSWWMSATLQADWLQTVDTRTMIDGLRSAQLRIPQSLRRGELWTAAKPCVLRRDVKDLKAWGRLIWDEHRGSLPGACGRVTLVVANTVKTAAGLHAAVSTEARKAKGTPPELHLVHSRFRGHERRQWRSAFLCRDACTATADRIIIATQVVEAGVDISATTLITELAPWPSLVQRFGRAGRYGEGSRILVVDRQLKESAAKPYETGELEAAADALALLPDASMASLEAFEEQHADLLPRLYPYAPLHLLLRRELDELFDTTPDLTGADLDISRFIRSGDERDVLVFWRDVSPGDTPAAEIDPLRDELCPVAFLDARKWLFDKGTANAHAWVWDYLDGAWRRCQARDVYPGQTILVELAAGGYNAATGWTGDSGDQPVPVPVGRAVGTSAAADSAQERDDLSQAAWKTIVTHGREVEAEAARLAHVLSLSAPVPVALTLAARWHDVGKAHPAFAACIRAEADGHPGRGDLAKAPPAAWHPRQQLYGQASGDHRAGFRHELASALYLLEVLARCQPLHPALLGPHEELLQALGHPIPTPTDGAPPGGAEAELTGLDGATFALLLYLVAAHHGKIRGALHASPQDQDYPDRDGRGMPIRGVRDGDRLPAIAFADAAGVPCSLPETELHLDPAAIGFSPRTGPSWTERVAGLMARHGPFALAYLEALARVADIRASRLNTPDPLLQTGGAA
jgi:CRISPR-associated endonuclease/helicase Cas3